MRILYYTWDECTFCDCSECMQRLGWQVDVVSYRLEDYDRDETFMEQVSALLRQYPYDCIFTFNYFPVVARIAREAGVPYVSWVYDSPHLTLDSVTVSYDSNSVFVFDHYIYTKYRQRGIQTIHYMPLAYNSRRMNSLAAEGGSAYEHDVTFMGSLYEDEYNFLEQVQYLPEHMKGYIDGLAEAQQLLYGCDLMDDLFGADWCERMAQYVKADLGQDYRDGRDDIFRNMIRRKVTVAERRRLLAAVGEHFPLDLYAPAEPSGIRMRYLGYADYREEMPRIFRSSKVNLNITLRSIIEGLPLRVIDIMGAGGFLLTNYQPEMGEYFVNGEDLVWFENREDLLDKVGFYLAHDKEREAIARRGHGKVEDYFTYENLLPEIMRQAGVR